MEYVFKLTEIVDKNRQVVPVKLPPEVFSVLAQVRQTVSVGDLVESMHARGQQTPGAAAALVMREAARYVKEINSIFGTKHSLAELTQVVIDGVSYYLPLIAGHRRHMTCLALNREIKEGRMPPSDHFDGLYRVDLHFGISAIDAIEYQFNENRHTQVPPHEEAEAAWRFWRYRKKLEPSITSAQFARSIGRSPEWMRNALHFCNLPLEVQSYVLGDNKAKLKLPYGILVDLARLAEGYESISGERLPLDAYHLWIKKAIIGRLNAVQFSKNVRVYLEEKRAEKYGQLSLFCLDSSQDLTAEAERRIRPIVAEHIVRGLWLFTTYFSTVERISRAGLLGHSSYLSVEGDRTPFSPGSPIRMLSRVVDLSSELVPHLAELARREKRGRSRKLKTTTPFLDEVQIGLRALISLEEGHT